MKTYTICGSMKFEKEMKETAFLLETQKCINVLQCIYSEKEPSESEKKQLAKAHYKKIDMSDGIYIMNINGYIGISVAEEIKYAQQQGKEIIYHHPIPAEEAFL